MAQPNDERLQTLLELLVPTMRHWREQHPRASLREIEAETDAQMARLRAELVQDIALNSPAADWHAAPPAEQPTCPHCQQPLQPRGEHSRSLRSLYDHPIVLKRQYGRCPQCAEGFFPPR